MSNGIAKVVHRLVKRGFHNLAALALWLSGFTRYDIQYILKVDLDSLRDHGVIINDFTEYVRICDERFQRYNKEDIEKLVKKYFDTVKELAALILSNASINELKILAYATDYVVRTGRFSVYGVSDYIRCSEVLENINVEHYVVTTLQKYLIYMCDKLYTCIEYSWTKDLVRILHNILSSRFHLPTDDEIIREIEEFLARPYGLRVLAAMYSMSTGSIDQFQLFHRRRVQDFLKDIKYVRYVYFNGFLNGLAISHIEQAVRKNIIERIVSEICRALGCSVEAIHVESIFITYELSNGVLVRVPKMYYFSPIFWSKPGAINIVFELPYSIRDYLLTYCTYFENSIVIFCKGTHIVSVYVVNDFDKAICESLSKLRIPIIVYGYCARH